MKKNSFLGLFGISVACAMLVGGARAVEYPYEMFSFFVPDASDGCSPIIGTKDTNGCYTITPQTLVDGQCTPTTPVQNVCDGAKGDKGDNAPTPMFAIEGENLKMTVDGTTTTLGKVTGKDGVSACAPLVTKETGTGSNMGCTRTNIQKQKMVNGSCINDGSITNGDWVCNGSNANVTSDTVKSALGLASNAIVATKADIPDVSGFQTAQDVKTSIAEETTPNKLQATLDNIYLKALPDNVVVTDANGKITSDKIPTLSASQLPANTVIDANYATVKAKSESALQQSDLSGYVTTSGSGDNSIGKILQNNNVVTTTSGKIDASVLPSNVVKTADLESYAKSTDIDAKIKAATDNVLTNDTDDDDKLAEAVARVLSKAGTCSTATFGTAETATCTSSLATAVRNAVVDSGASDVSKATTRNQ